MVIKLDKWTKIVSFFFLPLHRIDLVLEHSKIGSSSQPLVEGSFHVGGRLVGASDFCPVDVAFVALIGDEEVSLSEAEVDSSLDGILFVLLFEG